LLSTHLEQNSGDWRVKEAILHTMGMLHEQISKSMDLMKNVILLLQNYALSELGSQNPFMIARACWIYG
jgi:hypothetical protein